MLPVRFFSLILLGLTACSSSAGTSVLCPCAVGQVPTISYTGSFVSGAQRPPVEFTGIGETATITATIVNNSGQTVAVSDLSGNFVGPCTAAFIAPSNQGSVVVTPSATGTCLLALSSSLLGPTQVVIDVP